MTRPVTHAIVAIPLSLSRPLVGVDLETTSNVPDRARVCSIALEIYRPDGTMQRHYTFVNPGIPIPPEATAIHHITDEDAQRAPNEQSVLSVLLPLLVDVDFAGYNVRFDLTVLATRAEAYGIPFTLEGAAIVDPYRLWQSVEKRGLAEAIRRWLGEEVPADAPHSADWDIAQTMRVLFAQLGATDLPRDVHALHRLCSPGFIDPEGKVRWKDGVAVFGFGKYRDVALTVVPRRYFDWVCDRDFSPMVKRICDEARRGIFPEPPPEEVSDGGPDHRPAENH